jgi:DNA-binding transcriptional ArsR family regulator
MDQRGAVSKLGALAQESRLAVYRLLVEAGPEGLPAGAIGERLGLPGPTLSFHLAQLKGAGLLTCRRESRSLIYAADFAAMTELLAYLTENCCGSGKSCTPAVATHKDKSHETSSRSRRRRIA